MSQKSPAIHSRFFPQSSEEQILRRQATLAQEFHVYDENMLVSRLIYLSDKVNEIWKSKSKAIEDGKIYIGG